MKKSVKIGVGVVVAAIILVVVYQLSVDILPIIKQIIKNPKDMSSLTAYLREFGFRAIPMILFLQVVTLFIPGLPPSSVSILSGLCYGLIFGSMISILGIALSNSLLFIFSRKLEGVFFKDRKNSDWLDKFIDKAKNPGQAIFVLFLLPIVPNLLIPFLFANRGVRFQTFVLAMLAAIVPSTVIYCLVGARAQAGDFTTALTLLGIVAVILLATWFVVTIVKRKRA
ncbi:TVP38/TMEM64 family protein [Lactococcus insecticola]|uniref:TVP38/TMEM64 family membrane protein n=1 Tax=Pseudolactococcus insecticola TaxID=2709158 RepID=A0A6A0B550_9LACT|nr:VTT domain-containing protein [Lactococcus insecticola]GFH40136.1 hypothetical protein Hs20B_05340 [Lactococcus insecticola]